jgi:hypothetical protein
MGRDRNWPFDAVIGVGGTGDEPRRCGIAGKLTWVGIGAHRRDSFGRRGPLVSFDHFLSYDENGKAFVELAPHLAARFNDGNVRALMNDLSAVEQREVARILELAKNAPPSSGGRGGRCRGPRATGSKGCPKTSCPPAELKRSSRNGDSWRF